MQDFSGIKENSVTLTGNIISAAIEVHRALGPGLLESAYVACLTYELQLRGLRVELQKPLPLIYKNIKLDCGYRLDMIVNSEIIVEVKSISGFTPVNYAQLLSYLKLSGCGVGLLINFNVKILRNGIRRIKT